MKAFVCNEFGPVDIHKVEDVTEPELLDGQVLIDVKAAGVSFPEVLIVQGLYPVSYTHLRAHETP